MKMILFIVLAVFSASALAETLSWTPPTQRADGTPLDPMTELAEYRLVCGDVVTSIAPTVAEGEQYELTKHEVLPGYGDNQCYLTAVDTDGLESQPSETFVLNWQKAPPMSPTNVIIIVE